MHRSIVCLAVVVMLPAVGGCSASSGGAADAVGAPDTGADVVGGDAVGSDTETGSPAPASLDLSFDPGEGANARITTMALQPDGKVLIGGDFTEYDGVAISGIARLLPDGSLDATFDPGHGVSGPVPRSAVSRPSWVEAVLLQPDGKIFIAGNFTDFDGGPVNRVMRLNSDGSEDATFVRGEGPSSGVLAADLDHEGRLILGGFFNKFDGEDRQHIVRLLPDGRLDLDFAGALDSPSVEAIAASPDGKILVAVTPFELGQDVLVRLTEDGARDATFAFDQSSFEGAPRVTALAAQPDGRVLVGGHFVRPDGAQWLTLRLEADGAIDSSYIPEDVGDTGGAGVQDIALQPDGRAIITGNFFSPSVRLARVLSDGSWDADFNSNTGLSGAQFMLAFRILVQPDGQILLAGNFLSYGSEPRGRIARIHGGTGPSN